MIDPLGLRRPRLRAADYACATLALFVSLDTFFFTALRPRQSPTTVQKRLCATTTAVDKGRQPSRAPLADQIVLVIFDALTPPLAHASFAPLSQSEGSTHRQTETLRYISEALTDQRPGSEALLFVNVVDPPTTTAARIKAITTGTVPPFLEMASNFNMDAIVVDNMLKQLGGSAAVLGDDTWLNAFPDASNWAPRHNRQRRAAPINVTRQKGGNPLRPAEEDAIRDPRMAYVFPSFDVRDLHTVDNGVLRHLNDVLYGVDDEPNDRDDESDIDEGGREEPSRRVSATAGRGRGGFHPKLVIAHFLGLDHAGHRYHGGHAAIYGKVTQYDVILRNLSQALRRRAATTGVSSAVDCDNAGVASSPPRSTLLVVIGDHGMTATGDHGGASPAETETVLFAQRFVNPSVVNRSRRDTMRAAVAALTFQRQQHCGLAGLCGISERYERRRRDHQAPTTPRQSVVAGERAAFDALSPLQSIATSTRQVDLAATFSPLLGVPTPFLSTGVAIGEVLVLMGSEDDNEQDDALVTTHAVASEALACCQLRSMHEAYFPATHAADPDCGQPHGGGHAGNFHMPAPLSDAIDAALRDDAASHASPAARERVLPPEGRCAALQHSLSSLLRSQMTHVNESAAISAIVLGFSAVAYMLPHLLGLWDIENDDEGRRPSIPGHPDRVSWKGHAVVLLLGAAAVCGRLASPWWLSMEWPVISCVALSAAMCGASWYRWWCHYGRCGGLVKYNKFVPLLMVREAADCVLSWLPFCSVSPSGRCVSQHSTAVTSIACLVVFRYVIVFGSSYVVMEATALQWLGVALLVLWPMWWFVAAEGMVVDPRRPPPPSPSATAAACHLAMLWGVGVSSIGRAAYALGSRPRRLGTHHMGAARYYDDWFARSSWVDGLVEAIQHTPYLVHVVCAGGFLIFVVLLRAQHGSPPWRIFAICFIASWFVLLCPPSATLARLLGVLQLVFLLLRTKHRELSGVTTENGSLHGHEGLPRRWSPSSGGPDDEGEEPSRSASCRRPFLVWPRMPLLIGFRLYVIQWLLFFATGGQCLVSAVNWNAAFVGTTGYDFGGGGVLIFCDTFWPMLLGPMVHVLVDVEWWSTAAARASPHRAVDRRGTDCGPPVNIQRQGIDASIRAVPVGRAVRRVVRDATVFFHMVEIACTMAAATAHFRHLEWEVFVTRFSFALCATIASFVGSVAAAVVDRTVRSREKNE